MLNDILSAIVLTAMIAVGLWALMTPDPCFYGPGC